MSRRLWISSVVLLSAGAGAAACSLAYDLTDYSGGTTAKDSGIVDSVVDTEGPADSSTEDTEGDSESPDTDVTADSSDSTIVAEAGDGATDTKMADDTSVAETAVDSGTMTDAVVETPMTDAGCGALCLFGVSEIMVRPTSGTGDKREWVELTNYDSTSLDVSGVTVKVFSSTEKASFTFPAGTTLAAGEAVVLVDDEVSFKADVDATYTLGKVYGLAMTPLSDVFVNGGPTVRVYAPGSSTSYESAITSKSTWTVGHSYSYPPPSAACPASARFTAGTGAYSASWKETPADVASQYGQYMSAGMPVILYGTPTKSNAGIGCP